MIKVNVRKNINIFFLVVMTIFVTASLAEDDFEDVPNTETSNTETSNTETSNTETSNILDDSFDDGSESLTPSSRNRSSSDDVEEVVVTALGREVSLLDAPASVEVFTQERIADAGIQRVHDFIQLTPGVSLVDTAEIQDTQVSIRGINGARDAESNFALVVDGILLTNPGAFNRELVDIQQIEILKGPQGALYGRNGIAGAILINTVKPDPEELFGKTIVSIGNNNSTLLQEVINVPLSDNFALRITASNRSTDGHFTNSYTGNKEIDNLDDTNFLLRLTGEIADDIQGDFKIGFGEASGPAISYNAAVHLPGSAAFLGNPLLDEDVNDHTFRYINNIRSSNDSSNFNASAKFNISYDEDELSFYFAFNQQENNLLADGSSAGFAIYLFDQQCLATTAARSNLFPSPFFAPNQGSFTGLYPPFSPTTCDGYQYQQRDQTDFTFDIKYQSNSFDQDTQWTVGASLYNIDRQVIVSQGADDGTPAPANRLNPRTDLLYDDTFTTEVFAVYGNFNFVVTDDFDIQLDLRYDSEAREVSNNVPHTFNTELAPFSNPDAFPITGQTYLNPAFGLNGGQPIPDRSETFSQFQPKIGFSYHDGEVNFYGSYGIGFRSGGFNAQGTQATINTFYCPTGTPANTPMCEGGNPNAQAVFPNGVNLRILNVQDSYDQEVATSGELGVKFDLVDDSDTRYRIELGYYSTVVEDMQFFHFLVGPFGLLRTITNIDEVEINGLEFGATFETDFGLTVDLAYSSIDSEIMENRNRPYTVGNQAPFAPEEAYSFALQWKGEVGDGLDFLFRIEQNFTGATYFGEVQDGDGTLPNQFTRFLFGETSDNTSRRDAFSLTNMRIGWIWEDGFTLTFWGNNIMDTEYLAEVIPSPEFGGSFIHDAPRASYGVEFGVTY